MAVYNLTNNNGGNPWDYLAAKAVGGLFDHVIGGMLDRAAQAREAKRAANVYGGFAQAMSDPNAGRTEFINALAALRPNDVETKSLIDLYRPQFEQADKLGYGDAIAQRIGNLDLNVRNNPALAVQNGMVAQAYGMKPEKLWEFAYPNLTSQNIDRGDKWTNIAFDPATGKQVLSDLMKGIDPKEVMADATRRRGQDITLHNHDTPSGSSLVPSYSTYTGADGTVYTVNNRTGTMNPTNVKGQVKGQGRETGVRPYTTQQKLSIGAMIRKGIEDLRMSGTDTPEDRWNYIVGIVGDDPEALKIGASVAFPDGRIPKAASEFLKAGAVRPAGVPGEQDTPMQEPVQITPSTDKSAEYFPASRLVEYAKKHNMTPADARAYIEQQGYVIK